MYSGVLKIVLHTCKLFKIVMLQYLCNKVRNYNICLCYCIYVSNVRNFNAYIYKLKCA